MIGSVLRELRQTRELKQEWVATQIGISQCHLSAIEQGKKRASVELLERFSAFYNTSSVEEAIERLFQR